MNRIVAALVVIIPSAILLGCDEAPIDHHESDKVALKMEADSAVRLRELRPKHVYIMYGDDAGDLYVHCQEEPPKHAANQARCKALMDRIQKDNAAYDAAEAKAKAKW